MVSEYEALVKAVELFSKMPQNKDVTQALKRVLRVYKPIKLASAKEKGLTFQREVRADLISKIGINPDDIMSTPAGLNGCDIYLSPAARSLWLNAGIECKKQEERSLNFWRYWDQASANAQAKASHPMMVLAKNHSKKLVVVEWDWFLELTAPMKR